MATLLELLPIIPGAGLLLVTILVGGGHLVPGPPRRSPCSACRLRSLTLGAPNLVSCTHDED